MTTKTVTKNVTTCDGCGVEAPEHDGCQPDDWREASATAMMLYPNQDFCGMCWARMMQWLSTAPPHNYDGVVLFDGADVDPPRANERHTRAMRHVAKVMNDRKGYHVDQLDEGPREDLLGAIVNAVMEVLG